MLKNSRIKMIISLLIAVALWVFVVGSMDPTTKKEYSNIPVTFNNVTSLNNQGLAIAKSSVNHVKVILQGKKSVLNDIESEDIKAYIKAENLSVGENQCNIIIKAPSKTYVYDQDYAKAIVYVESIKYENKSINVSAEGDDEGDTEVTVISQEKDQSTVYGASSLVSKVDHINAILDKKSISNTEDIYQARLVAVDKNNKEISNVKILDKTISVTAIKHKLKTVPLNLNVRGIDDNGVNREIAKPSEVTIKGPSNLIKTINSVKAKDVYVSNIYHDSKVKINVILPDGVKLSDNNKEIYVKVTTEAVESRTFEVSSKDIDIIGNGDYQIEDKTISIIVKGEKSIVNSLTNKDFTLTVEINNQDDEQIRETIICKCDKELNSIDVNPKKIKLTKESK